MAADSGAFDRGHDDAATGGQAGGDLPEARVGWRYTLSQVRRDPTALAGLALIGFMTLVALVAFVDGIVFDFLADYEFFASRGVEQYWFANNYWVNPERDPGQAFILQPPAFTSIEMEIVGRCAGQTYTVTQGGEQVQMCAGSMQHPLGTDHRGRDILVRLFYGTRIAITVGIVATGIAMVLGTLVGAVAGYYGGYVDDALMRAAETLFAIPFLILVIAFMTAFGRNLTFAMVGVGIATIPTFARLIRSRVLSVREEDYIEAARAAGVRDRDVILRHIIPNSFAPVLVQATLQVGVNILIIAGLSFLGYGAQPPTPSWGQMLSNSRNYMLPNPWFSIWPGLAILVTVIGFNLLGDGLRDALDPRIQN